MQETVKEINAAAESRQGAIFRGYRDRWPPLRFGKKGNITLISVKGIMVKAALARLQALEHDNAGPEVIELNDDDDASLDDDDSVHVQKRQSKNTKRRTRQAKALENAKKAPRTFLELLQEANLESLPRHVSSYLRAAVGSPSSTSRRHFCTVCGFTANYTCVRCGVRFCSGRCQNIHNDTRCLKFVT